MSKKTFLAPSILAADFANLAHDISLVESAGAQYIHVDVMDGHFVPNISLGLPVVQAIRPHIKGIMDVHLMVMNGAECAKDYIEAGADNITISLEACIHLHRTVHLIKSLGATAAVALNPATPVSSLADIIDDLDMVLIMSVNPGYGGQSFIENTYRKIRQVREMSPDVLIQVDGGVDLTNVDKLVAAGANVFVAGSAVFGADDVTKRVEQFLKMM